MVLSIFYSLIARTSKRELAKILQISSMCFQRLLTFKQASLNPQQDVMQYNGE